MKQWSTLYVEYKRHESRPTEYKYIVKSADSKITSGTFSLMYDDLATLGFEIGARSDKTRFFKGEISSLEIYHVNEAPKPLPECLKNLVIDKHVMKKVT